MGVVVGEAELHPTPEKHSAHDWPWQRQESPAPPLLTYPAATAQVRLKA